MPINDMPINDMPINDMPIKNLTTEKLPSSSGTRTTSRPAAALSFPEESLIVRPWHDPVLEQKGHDPRSRYVEQYWVAILGPSATLLLRRFAAGLEHHPDGFEIDPKAWALELGLGVRGGKNGPFWRSIDRACRFGAARRYGNIVAVRNKLAPLSARQVERLPPHLQRAHTAWSTSQSQADTPLEAA